MKNQQKSNKPLRSLDEYRRRISPQSYKKEKAVTDPKQLGFIFAPEIFDTLKPILKGRA